jgi:hypothetical protein
MVIQGVLDTTLWFNKGCQWLAAGQWFSPGTPVYSTNKTDQIVFVDDNVLTVKFLHPAKSNVFKWPEKEDTSIIDNIFVFHFGFDILPKDSFGRTWYIEAH